jgi:hypothetical protein
MLTMQCAIAASYIVRAVIRGMGVGVRVHRLGPFHGLIHLSIGKAQNLLLS